MNGTIAVRTQQAQAPAPERAALLRAALMPAYKRWVAEGRPRRDAPMERR